MSIRFACQQCGLPLTVDEHFQGRHARCKRCGHVLTVPAADTPDTAASGTHHSGAGLRLQPLDEEEPVRAPAHLLAAAAPLNLQPAGPERHVWPGAVSPPEDLLKDAGPSHYHVNAPQLPKHRGGPPPLWTMLPSLTARFAARRLRKLRDLLYVISLASMVAILFGCLFKWKVALHAGAVIIVAANVGLLVVGLIYLVSLPFKDHMFKGLACLLVPFYGLYYWGKHWRRMRRPVMNTVTAFLPMVLVGLAYFGYEAAPMIEERWPEIEQRIDQEYERLESALGESGPADRAIERVESKVEKHADVDETIRRLESSAGKSDELDEALKQLKQLKSALDSVQGENRP
ncbi:MAG TPA: hypothetical protein VJ783_21305 [Pirellulales bacterium]|nr:hypothetical protein [Pirellulales bacterium]